MVKNCVWVIIGIIFIGSVVLDTNVFEELFWPVRIFFIILAIKFGFYGGGKGRIYAFTNGIAFLQWLIWSYIGRKDIIVEKSLENISISWRFASDIDFKEEIESHSPLKVIVENS